MNDTLTTIVSFIFILPILASIKVLMNSDSCQTDVLMAVAGISIFTIAIWYVIATGFKS